MESNADEKNMMKYFISFFLNIDAVTDKTRNIMKRTVLKGRKHAEDATAAGVRSLSAFFLTGLMRKSSTVIVSADAYERVSAFKKNMKTDSSVK